MVLFPHGEKYFPISPFPKSVPTLAEGKRALIFLSTPSPLPLFLAHNLIFRRKLIPVVYPEFTLYVGLLRLLGEKFKFLGQHCSAFFFAAGDKVNS